MKEKFANLVSMVKDNPGKALAIGAGIAVVLVVGVKAVQYAAHQPEFLGNVGDTLVDTLD